MTAEEKINQYIAGLSYDEKIERMMDCIADYDVNTLIEMAQGRITDDVSSLGDRAFDEEYYEWFSCDLDEMFEDDESKDDESKDDESTQDLTFHECSNRTCPMFSGLIEHAQSCIEYKN